MNIQQADIKVSDRPVASESLKSHWLKGSFGGVAMQGAAMALGFASSVVLARLLGPQGLGEFGFVRSLVAVLSVLAAFGLPTVVARLFASYAARQEYPLARGLWQWAARRVVGFSFLGSGGLFIYGMLQSGHGSWQLYAWAAPLIATLALTQLRQRALQALDHPILAQLPEQLFKHLAFLGLVGIMIIAGDALVFSAEGLMAFWLIANVISLLLGMALLRRVRPADLKNGSLAFDIGEWKAIAWPIFVANGLGVVLGNSDTILLGLLQSPEQVGFYQVALQLAGLLFVLLGASNWVLAPWFSRFHVLEQRERMQSVVTKAGRAVFVVTMLIFLGMLLVGKPVLGWVFGKEFESAYPMMLILGFGRLVDVACGPVVTILSMTGGQKDLVQGVGGAALINLMLCGLLVPKYGGMGAAFSVALVNIGYNLYLSRRVFLRSGLRTTVLG